MKTKKILGQYRPLLISVAITSIVTLSSIGAFAQSGSGLPPPVSGNANLPSSNINGSTVNNTTTNNSTTTNTNGAKLSVAPVDMSLSAKFNLRVFYRDSTFENIFYKNLAQELEIQQSRNQNTGKENLEANIIKYATQLTPGQLNEAIEIGLADVSLIPTSNFYDSNNESIDFLDYPFMFTDLNQVQNRFFGTTRLMFTELNKRSSNAIPIAVMPYSFRIIVSQKKNLTTEDIINDPITIEDNLVVKKSYSLFKPSQTVKFFDKSPPNTQTLDVSILDFFDNKYYQNYKNVYMSNHSLKSYVLVVGKNWWISLTAPQRDFVVQSLSRSVQKSSEEIINFNSVILSTLEAQSEITIKKVDYFGDWAGLRNSLNQMHYRAAGNPQILKYYKSIQGN